MSTEQQNQLQVKESSAIIESVPEYMQGAETGLESINQHTMPSMLKVIQGQSDRELKQQFGEGSAIISPDGVRVYDGANPQIVNFTPIYFYTEYMKWNALGQSPLILDRSFDPNSQLAKLCENAKMWKVLADPNNIDAGFIRHSKHLNFIVLLHLQGLEVKPVLLSFVRGTFKLGQNFMKMIQMRSNVPLYGTNYSFSVKILTSGGNDYYGIVTDYAKGVSPTVDESTFRRNKLLYENFKSLHQSNQLETRVEEDGIIDGEGVVVEQQTSGPVQHAGGYDGQGSEPMQRPMSPQAPTTAVQASDQPVQQPVQQAPTTSDVRY